MHAGESKADEAVLDELHEICGSCFRALLKLQAAQPDTSGRSEAALRGWLANVDYLAKGLIAGKAIEIDQFRDAHIRQS